MVIKITLHGSLGKRILSSRVDVEAHSKTKFVSSPGHSCNILYIQWKYYIPLFPTMIVSNVELYFGID